MLIKIAFFDKYVNENELLKILKQDVEVVNKELCFSGDVRLRKNWKDVYTFNVKDFKSNAFDVCYGVLYTLKIEDLEWFNIVFTSSEYKKSQIKVRTFTTTVEDFIKNKICIGKSDNVINYSAIVNDRFKSKYRNRHAKVSFHRNLFINILNNC